MLRYRLKELLADKEYKDGRVITMIEVANATGVHRMTLSKIANQRGCNPTADVLDRLCAFFGCRIEQLVEHIPDANSIEKQLTDSPKRVKKQEPPKGDSC